MSTGKTYTPETKARLVEEFVTRRAEGKPIKEMLEREGIAAGTLNGFVRQAGMGTAIRSNARHAPKSKTRRVYTTKQKIALLDEIEANVRGGGTADEVLQRHNQYSSVISRWRVELGRPLLRKLGPKAKAKQRPPERGPVRRDTGEDWLLTFDERPGKPGAEAFLGAEDAALGRYLEMSKEGRQNLRLWRAASVEIVMSARLKGKGG
jgi:transposase-like protein